MTKFIIEYETQYRFPRTFVTLTSGLDPNGAINNFLKRRHDVTPRRIARVSGTWHEIEHVPEPQWKVKE